MGFYGDWPGFGPSLKWPFDELQFSVSCGRAEKKKNTAWGPVLATSKALSHCVNMGICAWAGRRVQLHRVLLGDKSKSNVTTSLISSTVFDLSCLCWTRTSLGPNFSLMANWPRTSQETKTHVLLLFLFCHSHRIMGLTLRLWTWHF